MFYLLCLTLCLAVMFLVVAVTSVLSLPVAPLLESRLEHASARTASNLLLVLRLLPFSLAVAVSIGLVLPAFMEFEPPSTQEMVNVPLIVLAALGCGVLIAMITRGLRMWRMTRFMQHEWQKHSHAVSGVGSGVPLYRVDSKTSLLAVTGVFKPRIFISRAVAEALTEDELSAALSHEIAHVRSHDNLKQVLMKIMAPPRWIQGLQSTGDSWVSASEMAADESALAGGASALELSSALIKVGRLSLANTVPGTVAASHLVPCGCSSATLTRAAHLRDLLEKGTIVADVQSSGRRKTVIVLALIAVAYVGCLVTLLPAVHEALEFLVR
jgi:beta-lactamase regulating signal transducer with metallopeptidase domain